MKNEKKFQKCENAFKKSERNIRIKFCTGLFILFFFCMIILITIPLKFSLLITTAILIILFIIFPPTILYRRIKTNGADTDQYKQKPCKTISAATTPAAFEQKNDHDLISSLMKDELKINNLDNFLELTDTTAFMVIRDKKILYEKYFNGYTKGSGQAAYSITKSILSVLIGIAIDERRINSVYDPITKYIPELEIKDSLFSIITIKDLLMMSSGIRYSENIIGDNFWVQFSENLRKTAIKQSTIENPPESSLLYNNLNPILLGLILERVIDSSIIDYLKNKIWHPVGMEYSIEWNIDSRFHGFELVHNGLIIRTIDLAKLGQLFLDKGVWNGKRIVSESWIKESTRPSRETIGQKDRCRGSLFTAFFNTVPNGYYQYQWWGIKKDENNYDFLARGVNAQLLYVCPQKNLIIVRNGKDYGIGTNDWINVCHKIGTKI